MKQTNRFGEAFGGVDQALPIMRQHQSNMMSLEVAHEPELTHSYAYLQTAVNTRKRLSRPCLLGRPNCANGKLAPYPAS
jgi:hypothetical protein